MLNRITTFTHSSPQSSTVSVSPNNGSQSPITPTNINLLSSLNSPPNGTSPLIANLFQPSNTLPTNVNPTGSPNSPPLPPRRVFSRGPSLRRSRIGQVLQPPPESEASLAEQNAKLHLMVSDVLVEKGAHTFEFVVREEIKLWNLVLRKSHSCYRTLSLL